MRRVALMLAYAVVVATCTVAVADALVVGRVAPDAAPSASIAATPARGTDPSPSAPATRDPVELDAPPRAPDEVIVAAGDIASCASPHDEATAALLDAMPGTVLTLGDNVYDSGAPHEFARCYAPTWGRHKARTRPAPGNHDYQTLRAAGYFAYFGDAAGEPERGYYTYRLGNWQLFALNSNCWAVGGCDAGSAQASWLREQLAVTPRGSCILAYWHHPLFSSGTVHGGNAVARGLAEALHEAHADVILTGHEHIYERFALRAPSGAADPERGFRQFIVGTGGRSLYGIGRRSPDSEIALAAYGVLRLTLRHDAYEWAFIGVGGATLDSGTSRCHAAP